MRAFRGGLVFAHETSMKQRAAKAPLLRLSPPELYLSLKQGNALLTPCVSAGQTVRIGDVIATDPDQKQPPLHSGVSGVVRHIDRVWPTVGSGRTPTVVIENDHRQQAGHLMSALPSDADPDDLVTRMYDAGLVGLGGGGFPTHRKYRGRHADWLLINACECEPFLAADAYLCLDQPHLVAEGARLFARAAGVDVSHIRLCTESAAVAQSLKQTGLPTVCLKARYPQGSERQLIESVLHQRLPDGVYPIDRGIAVSNAATAAAMADAARGLALTHRLVTVSGRVAQPYNAWVPIGTPFEQLLLHAQPLSGRLRVIAGGPMTGTRLLSTKAGIPKTCGGVVLIPSVSEEEQPCIRCGACVRVCPVSIMPFLIDIAALHNDEARCRELRASTCISCGCCSYVCPARRQLAARITAVKRGGIS